MASPDTEHLLRVARRDLNVARRLMDPEVEEASWGWAVQQCLEKPLKAWLHIVGTKPPQIDDPEQLGLDRTAWSNGSEALIEHVQSQIG